MMDTGRQSAWAREPAVQAMVRCNPLHGNPLATRADLQRAIRALHAPLLPWYSDSGARVRVGVGGVHYGSAAAEMEGFTRPLWGLAPLAAAGEPFEGRDLYPRGLANGTDAAHPDYWGDVARHDQRMVEMAGLAQAILLSPATFWDPLSEAAKARAAAWMRSINEHPTADNNWLFFRVMVNLALRHVGEAWSEPALREALDRLDSFHIADGWYRDGKWYQLDYYTPMGMHFYGLMLAKLAPEVASEHAARFRERARSFAQDFQHWFADDGAAVPFGRSMTYRFVQGAFWAACAFADEEVLPWGRMKGLLLRHLRWWSRQPIADRDGILSIGYAYPNLLVSEAYNAPASPYWGLKTFLVAALAENHPFWTAEEEPAAAVRTGACLSQAGGLAVRREPGDALLLTGGQDGREHRGHDAKYARFAYSSAFGMSVASDSWAPDRPERSAVDCGMMVSRDGRLWQSRSQITEAGIDRGLVFGRWTPDEGLAVDTWLDFAGPGWHVRVHRIVTADALQVAEGGFAVDRTGDGHLSPEPWFTLEPGRGFVRTLSAVSGIVDLDETREADIIRASPNTNLLFPRTFFPRLLGSLSAGTHVLGTLVFAMPDPDAEIGPVAISTPVKNLLAVLRAVTT